MDVFELRKRLVDDYSSYVKSFIRIRDKRIGTYVEERLSEGLLWPEPLIQMNPSFEMGEWIEELVDQGVLHKECREVFRIKTSSTGESAPLRLYRHQAEAARAAKTGGNYVLTTGTGSGKSLSYIVPIVNHVLKNGSGKGVTAIVVYPMNALANSQYGELEKFLCHGFLDGKGPVTFERYTGQESDEKRRQIVAKPPDILLTNFVMLELILTRPAERALVRAAEGLRFLVLDELHTYRGRQGADVALLIRRVRETLAAEKLQCIGTSATLAGPGTVEEQRREVARVASALFGSEVRHENVINETLRRASPHRELNDPTFIEELAERIRTSGHKPAREFGSFVTDPLSIWLESTLGVRTENNRLVRQKTRKVSGNDGAAAELSQLTGVAESECSTVIHQGLLGGYSVDPDPETGAKPFAFRLHQFISRGDTVYASLDPEGKRYVTVFGQQFVPHDRSKILLPLVFCRECGQEYYCVRTSHDGESGTWKLAPREISDQFRDGETEPGFLYANHGDPWSSDSDMVLQRVPDDWLEEVRGTYRIRSNRREYLPRLVRLDGQGKESPEGNDFWHIPAPFRFCLHCGVSYGFREKSDFGKLTTLGSEGRSTATTVLCLSVLRNLKKQHNLPEKARKLLSFTDNRQDASLQAGHFNDFIEISLLRAALYQAAFEAGNEGLRHDELTQKVFAALNLPLDQYALDPAVRFQAREETDRALREVLGYRLYRDLRRGWRVTSPNLEQCGLLEIGYLSLEELCRATDVWENCHPVFAGAEPEKLMSVAKALLDYMRRELAIKVDYLDRQYQERIRHRSSQHLRPPWALDENERMEYASILYPKSRTPNDGAGNVFLSSRSGFGQFLRRPSNFDDLSAQDSQTVIIQLLECLRVAGLVAVAHQASNDSEVNGYQLAASAMVWQAGDGTRSVRDPIRVPNLPAEGSTPNPFFVDYYRTTARELFGFHGREHTAQVPLQARIEREERFREGTLPILFCSPTMELGVDIKQLNAVNLRNIPPTPANYAQRSGRAGRSGQPALVFSYSAVGSPHDQYFFKRPMLMVSGAVSTPRLDVANEDLVRAHVHAIWLAEANLSLGTTLTEILDVGGSEPSLALLPHVQDVLHNQDIKERALKRTERALQTILPDLEAAEWYSSGWLREVISQVGLSFDNACARWRRLYSSAWKQAESQGRIVLDASRSSQDKAEAKRLRREAEAQLELLTRADNVVQSDFYSYRYFASEGFLPGYNFPRLPISAFIPGGSQRLDRDEFVSRPRFLAISEFGPRSVIYHEGSRYVISRVILPAREEDLLTTSATICSQCGYLHQMDGEPAPDLCHRCHHPLGYPLTQLFRLQNVATRRRDKISSDEEERIRLGYEVKSCVRFVEKDGHPSCRTAQSILDGEILAELTYSHAAIIWRINLGWTRRRNRDVYGFMLDTERGYWAKNEQVEDDDDGETLSSRLVRVIPFVEDRRNSLMFEPHVSLSPEGFASLQAALKNAIQVRYQLEDSELAAEPLPDRNNVRLILFYEASEGGAGVLRRLLDDPQALPAVAREALSLCHFDPETGEDLQRTPFAQEDCEAACYDCLMSYGNQRDHALLDRHSIKEILLKLASCRVESSPTSATRAEQLESLNRLADSDLERRWLKHMYEAGLKLPSQCQTFIEGCKTRPDFLYHESNCVIYIDGPPHKYPERQERDREQTDCLEDMGYTVIRFNHEGKWNEIIAKYPYVFGSTKSTA